MSCGNSKSPSHQIPTRLIDLGLPGSTRSFAKLIETKTVPPQDEYITLSHCWGMANVPQLLESNLQSFTVHLPLLPKTFEEAFVVAKRIGARYIWIDSLW